MEQPTPDLTHLIAAIMLEAASQVSGGDYLDDMDGKTMSDREAIDYIGEFWKRPRLS